MVCKYCGKETRKENVPEEKSLQGHIIRCYEYKLHKERIIENSPVEEMRKFYDEGFSIAKVSEKFGINPKIVCKIFELNNIPMRSLQEAAKQKDRTSRISKKKSSITDEENSFIQKKRIETTQEKYGVDNVFQADSIKDKSKKTCLKNYGVEHSMKSKKVQNKGKKTMIEKYGVDNIFKSEEFKKNLPAILLKKYGVTHPIQLTKRFSSKIATEFLKELYKMLPENLKQEAYFHKHPKEFGKRTSEGKYYFYDFTLSKEKKIIEFNGDYWHANPEMYEATDLIRGIEAGNIWIEDRKKLSFIEDLGFETLVIWEKEVIENRRKSLEKCLYFLKGKDK